MARTHAEIRDDATGDAGQAAAQARAGDFHEIYAEFIDAKAAEQASRCSQCGVPFCQTH